MGLIDRLFGKKKTFEEKAKEAGIVVLDGVGSSGLLKDYSVLKELVRGSGNSKGEAENDLLGKARRENVAYLSGVNYDEKYGKQKVSAVGYVKITGTSSSGF